MQKKSLAVRVTAICLTGAFLCAGAALAAAGDRDDPLITLSYLSQTATPEILEEVERVAEKRQAELLEQLDRALNRGGTSSATGQTFSALTLNAGQRVTLSAGGEVMLRSGAASFDLPVADTTLGSTLAAGEGLAANHLYLISEGQSVLTAQTGITLLLRGSDTIG